VSDLALWSRKKGGAGRTRKTEKEEDEEMLQKADAELEEENAFSFSASPECRVSFWWICDLTISSRFNSL
jgi:hypothetical protein